MARPQSPRYPHIDPSRSRIRSREYFYALLAGIFVLAILFHSRAGSGLRPSAQEALPNDIPPPPTNEAVPATNPLSTAPGQNEHTDADLVALGLVAPPIATTSNSHSGNNGNSGSAGGVGGSSSGSVGGSNNNAGTGGASIITTPSDLEESSQAADRPLAVIIETAIIPNLVPVMLHFATVLGPSWGMVLFTLQANWIEPLSPAFQRHLESGRISVRFLPADTELVSSDHVSRFLTSPWIWEQVSSARRVLLFQTDSVLCSKSESAVEDYFQYDFVGAPIAARYGSGFNGGLSVRNPRTFLQIVREVDFAASGASWEDQFFYQELQRRGAPMPSEEEAKTFAVETIFYETPLGYHQPQRWQTENMQAIEEWCPEVKLLIGKRAN